MRPFDQRICHGFNIILIQWRSNRLSNQDWAQLWGIPKWCNVFMYNWLSINQYDRLLLIRDCIALEPRVQKNNPLVSWLTNELVFEETLSFIVTDDIKNDVLELFQQSTPDEESFRMNENLFRYCISLRNYSQICSVICLKVDNIYEGNWVLAFEAFQKESSIKDDFFLMLPITICIIIYFCIPLLSLSLFHCLKVH